MDQLRWDPFDVELDTDPYDTWRRMRDEAPVYRNEGSTTPSPGTRTSRTPTATP